MRLHVGGTVLAAGLAVLHGYAINLGGGMHHAYSTDGAGWCPYADITLAIRKIRCVCTCRISNTECMHVYV
jgi:histone deacetylase 11